MKNVTFSTTTSKMNWLNSVAEKSGKSVDALINMLVDGYLEDIEIEGNYFSSTSSSAKKRA